VRGRHHGVLAGFAANPNLLQFLNHLTVHGFPGRVRPPAFSTTNSSPRPRQDPPEGLPEADAQGHTWPDDMAVIWREGEERKEGNGAPAAD